MENVNIVGNQFEKVKLVKAFPIGKERKNNLLNY